VLEPVEAPGKDEPTAEREEAPTQVLDPHAETKVIEQPSRHEPPDRR
jgi:hypothetical protein